MGNLNNSWDWAKAQLDNISQNAGVGIGDILSKGGVFDNPGNEYSGSHLSYKYGNIIRTFSDPVARTKDSVTGEYYSGVPQYKPLTHSDGITSVNDSGYPFRLITYKTVHHGQARTNVNPWLMLMMPENPVEISAIDAAGLRVKTGDRVKVSSATHPGIIGKALVTEGLKPGVVAISHHYGHWEAHSRPIEIDGEDMEHDPSRGAGMQPNIIMRTDNLYPNVGLQEPIGGSSSFFDTSVMVRKV